MSDTIKIGQIGPRNGCIKFPQRSSKNSALANGEILAHVPVKRRNRLEMPRTLRGVGDWRVGWPGFMWHTQYKSSRVFKTERLENEGCGE